MNKRAEASNKYNKENTKSYLIRFNKRTDCDVIRKLTEVQNKTSYIRSLILKDIKR